MSNGVRLAKDPPTPSLSSPALGAPPPHLPLLWARGVSPCTRPLLSGWLILYREGGVGWWV